MPVTPKTLRLAQRARRDLLRVADAHTRELTKAWVDAWDDIAGDLEKALVELISTAQGGVISQATVLRSQRLRFALDVVARRLTRLTDSAGSQVTSDLFQIIRAAGEAQAEIIGAQLPKAEREKLAGWGRVDARQVNAIVQRSTEQITSQMWPLSAEADSAIRREIVRGLATGAGPRQTASAILARAEGVFNGGLSRALTIARTETLDAHRAAAQLAHDQNKDVLRGWMWLAATSTRTCPACLGMNGTEHPLIEPGPIGHQNCRCTRVPVTKSWKDLGIDIAEPAPAPTGSQAWFDSQTDVVQKQILGPAKYAAYQRGDFPMDKWAVRRSTDGWRDSYVPAPVPKPR
jgi:SPP1 gp7 family putative phage head morphogenesis protein